MLNAMNTTELNDETKFLLRKGMVLRKKHLELLFGKFVTDESYPDYIEKVHGSSFSGVDKEAKVKKYNAQMFKMGSRKLYDIFVHDPKKVLPASVINGLSDIEVRAAFFSGYLKHDSRGYYFTKNDRAMMEVFR